MIIDDLRTWVASLYPAMSVRIAPYKGPAPDGDYITLNNTGSKGSKPSVEKTAIVGDPDNVLYEAQNHVVFKVSINVYSEDGDEILHNIEASESLPPARLADDVSFRPIVASVGDVRNIPFIDDTRHAHRYQCDFSFRTSYTRSVIDPKVTRVQISGEFADMDSAIDTQES